MASEQEVQQESPLNLGRQNYIQRKKGNEVVLQNAVAVRKHMA